MSKKQKENKENKNEDIKDKKLYLNDDEKRNIASRQGLMREHEFYQHLLNNSIVEYLKAVVYKRLGLDPTQDYPLSNDGSYLLIERKETNVESSPAGKEMRNNQDGTKV